MNDVRKLNQVITILKQHFSPRDTTAYLNAARGIVEEMTERMPERTKTESLIGFSIIGDMTRDELINECCAFHRMHCQTVDTDELKNAVIASRLMRYKDRLLTEAKMSPPTGLFGFGGFSPIKTDDE